MPPIMHGARVQQITGTNEGTLYLATGKGIMLYDDGGQWQMITFQDNLLSDNVRAVLRANDGSLWVAYGFGRGMGAGFGRARPPGFGDMDGVSRFVTWWA